MDILDIHHAYTKDDMTFREAVIRLQKIGHDKQEANRIVTEWAAANDNDRNKGYDITDSDYDEQMGGY
jgi:hypothetical protein